MNEDIRDCENCKHYVLHDKTVHLPPIYACEEWECEFEPEFNVKEWLSSFNTESATVCFTEIQELKKKVEKENE